MSSVPSRWAEHEPQHRYEESDLRLDRSGEQKLTGQKALWYVRSCDGSDNYDRSAGTADAQALRLDQVNPQELAIAYPKLAGSAGRNILTDIPQSQVSAFVELAAAMQGGEIKSAQINNDVTSMSSLDYEELHEWVEEQINPAEPSQAEEQAAPQTEEPEETEEPEPTEEPKSGIEDDQGKCYRRATSPDPAGPAGPAPRRPSCSGDRPLAGRHHRCGPAASPCSNGSSHTPSMPALPSTSASSIPSALQRAACGGRTSPHCICS